MENKKARSARASKDSLNQDASSTSPTLPPNAPQLHTNQQQRSSLFAAQSPQKPIPRRPSDASVRSDAHPSHIDVDSNRASTLKAAEGNVSRSNQHMTRNEAMVDMDGVQELHIAVLGCAGVGKSTFMQCALDSKSGPSSRVRSKKVSLEGTISIVRLVELDFDDIRIVDGRLKWPEKVEGYALSAVDGALLLFDITQLASIGELSNFVGALNDATIPTVLVASKCDTSPKSWTVTPKMIESIAKPYKDIQSFQTALCTPETHKRCISIMLRNVILQRHGAPCTPKKGRRHRAATSSQPTNLTKPSPNLTTKAKHGRAASEIPEEIPCASFNTPMRYSEPVPRPRSSSGFLHPKKEPGSLESDIGPDLVENPFADDADVNASRTNSTQSNNTEATLNTNDSSLSDLSLKDSLLLPNEKSAEVGHDHVRDAAVSFEYLVDRLLAAPMSKQDARFATIFLCLYRMFAAPSDLLAEVLKRFESVQQAETPDIIKLSVQLRHLTILHDWISEYPGDFAHPATRHVITNFVQTLANQPQFLVAHKEIGPCLDNMCEDDDAEWACSDQARSRASTIGSFLSTSSTRSATSTVTAESSAEEVVEPTSPSEPNKRYSTWSSASQLARPNTDQDAQLSIAPAQKLLNRVEDARSQAQSLKPIPRFNLDKIRWHQMMDLPIDHIASELTYIDWILYSSIRPRDLVRHVSLNTERKQNCRSLEHVNAMIHHFNHTAFWVANMVLIRDKPKHRALMLEKIMLVAWRLRQQNNYHSLGAIIAGINGTAVHRLSQTRALVSPETRKQFMRLEILMATSKSHSAYRLGWQNTSSPRIPFLPLHRRDIVSAEAGNKTLLQIEDGERVNWKKFDIMGDVVISIRESQGLPYPSIDSNLEARRLILGGKFSRDEDELYERSIQLERQGVGENFRKKFNWFTR